MVLSRSLLLREHVAWGELDAALDLLDGQDGRAGHVDAPDPELRALHDGDADDGFRPRPIDLDVGGLHARLDVAVVVVELHDALDVLIELLPLHRPGEDVVVPLLRGHDGLDVFGWEPVGPLDHDAVDGDLASLRDAERDRHVAIGQLLDVGGHRHLEVALLLVGLFELLRGPIDVDGIVDTAEPQVDLLGQRGRVELFVAAEDDVPHERPLDDDERDLDPAFKVLHLELHVVEEPEREDRPQILGEARRLKLCADLDAHTPENDGLLDAAIPLNHDVFDDDRRSSGWRRC